MQEMDKLDMEERVYDEVQNRDTLKNPGAVDTTLNLAYNALTINKK